MDRAEKRPAVVYVSADGRWGGELTSRPLPDDPSIDDLSPETRAVLADAWSGRAASERRVGDAFVVVRDALASLGAGAELIELAARAIDDEMRHAELSRRIASRYAGRELEHPPLLPLNVPRHARADERLRRILHVIGQSCLNETIASAFLEATLVETDAPLARAAVRELLADEIDHARIGWATVAATDAAMRRAIGEWLPEMAIANLRMWREAPRLYASDRELARHGAPREETVAAALLTAFRDLIVPGFAHLDVRTDEVVAWLDAGAPT